MATTRGSSRRVLTVVMRGHSSETRWDAVVGEEPLQIRACGPGQTPEDIVVTMRTPGGEEELAVGFLVAEGLLEATDVGGVEFEFSDPALVSQPHNEILVCLPGPLDLDAIRARHFVATASCGICGRASSDELLARVSRLPPGPTIERTTLLALPDAMRTAQEVFEETGGLHAAALFTPDAELIELREDLGRHNAVDKLIGARGLAGELPANEAVLLVSGRVSFEIVQKAAVAGVPILCAVSAPSDLAISTAEQVGMTLVGFLREDGFNVYEAAERIDLEA